MYHETIRDIHAAQGGGCISCITKISEIYALHEGGLRVVDHEMFRDLLAVVSMHISEPQSRTFPLYMTFWQLHSILYLEKSRDIWDSVVVELATKVNQSSACWAPKANPQLGLWVVSKANQPSLVLLEVEEMAPMVTQSSA